MKCFLVHSFLINSISIPAREDVEHKKEKILCDFERVYLNLISKKKSAEILFLLFYVYIDKIEQY